MEESIKIFLEELERNIKPFDLTQFKWTFSDTDYDIEGICNVHDNLGYLLKESVQDDEKWNIEVGSNEIRVIKKVSIIGDDDANVIILLHFVLQS